MIIYLNVNKTKCRKRLRTDQVADMDEEAQLAAAIKASLVETLAASNPQVCTVKCRRDIFGFLFFKMDYFQFSAITFTLLV